MTSVQCIQAINEARFGVQYTQDEVLCEIIWSMRVKENNTFYFSFNLFLSLESEFKIFIPAALKIIISLCGF